MATINLSVEVPQKAIMALTSSILEHGILLVGEAGQTQQLWPSKICVHTDSGSTVDGSPGSVLREPDPKHPCAIATCHTLVDVDSEKYCDYHKRVFL